MTYDEKKQREGYIKYKKIIKEASKKWNIPEDLLCAIIYQESRFDENASRYESLFYKKYVQKQNCTQEEKTWRATSWSLMQTMGQVLRETGFRGPTEVALDPVINVYYGCKFFTKLLKRYKGNLEDAIAAYNQGNNRFKDLDKDGIKDSNEFYYNQHYVDGIKKWREDFKKIIDSPDSEPEKKEETKEMVHIVKSGDNLSKIANKYDTTISAIMEANKNIKDENIIHIDQKIKIPEK